MTSLKLAAARRAEPLHTTANWLGMAMWLMTGLVMVAMLLMASPARAADEVPDPPDRVGRLSDLAGQVWIYAPESNEWIAASRNRPITSGDRLSTEGDGRAEVRIGSTVLRVDGNSELEVLQLDDQRIGLQLHSGSVTARLRTREAANQFGLATNEGRFTPLISGNYRFDRIDDTSSATVTSGQLRYENEGTALTLQPGQRAEFWKENGQPQYSMTEPKRDAFSDWVASRDKREDRSVSSRYVSPEMTGVEDLDRYGRWDQTEDYGAVWVPREVVPGWAPYRMGHWAWVSPWGWTWVDDAPWGFAPFHYGRWVSYRGAWCWTPGRYVARPVYSPALVAWVGGPAVSVSVSIGGPPSVGWFPLGPREIYVPNYHVSPRYVREVNVTHVTNINVVNVTNIINNPNQYVSHATYVNRGIPNAVTVVPTAVMEHRQPVAPAVRHLDDRQLRNFAREAPRVDAPVTAPPHAAPGFRRIEDPRTGRENLVATPGGPQNDRVPPSPRWQRGGEDGNRHNANGSGREIARGPGGNAQAEPPQVVRQQPQQPPQQQQQPGREPQPPSAVPGSRERGREPGFERRGRDVPPPQQANTAPAAPATAPTQPAQQQGVQERGRPPVAPVAGATPAVPPKAPPAERVPVAPPQAQAQPPQPQQPQREGRMRNHEMPGPPRLETQAPAAPAQPRPQVQQPQQSPAAPPANRPAEPPHRDAQVEQQRQRAAEERQRGTEDRQRAAEERSRERGAEQRERREDRGEREGRGRAQ